jgi:hypothetical protein
MTHEDFWTLIDSNEIPCKKTPNEDGTTQVEVLDKKKLRLSVDGT